MRYPAEPHILVGPVLVHSGAVSLLGDLLARGYAVALVDGVVRVTPDPADLHEDTQYLIEAFDEDLHLLLSAGGLVVH